MLNLTESAITLIAESGETTEIPASGYVARVETTRQEVGYPTISSALNSLVPIIEETPTRIWCVHTPSPEERYNVTIELAVAKETTRQSELLLVTREVAEAAATLHVCADGSAECDWIGQPGGVCTKKGKRLHPLWRRMVFVHGDDAQYQDRQDENGKRVFASLEFQGYVGLRRVPQGGAS